MEQRELQAWLAASLAGRLGVAQRGVDVHRRFEEYGLTSRDAVEVAGELEELLDCVLEPTVVYRYPTIASLAEHLAGVAAGREQRGAGVAASEDAGPARAGDGHEPIAVVGLGCRLPGGADDPAGFWRLLLDGFDAIGEVPPDRWLHYAEGDPEVAALLERTSSLGGYLDDVAGFDAAFFGISPREAAAMDPQQRLVLEVSWETLEHAGIPPLSLAGSATGVFVGAASADYGAMQTDDLLAVDAWTGTGSSLSIIANRVSYLFGLQGPSLVVDTACSASLVAVHLACQSLRAGESDLALAGGVNLLLSPAITVNFDAAGVMASDGRCKTFDASADGYVRSEGCGMVALKRLSDALEAGDPVLATLRGSAVNQDGHSNGLMAPNPQAQEALLRRTYRVAGVDPSTIDYVEAHGTGTALGDPIEVRALASVLGEGRADGTPCLIGSVKTNVGHLEAAAGVAGLIKTVLSLRAGELPPSLHYSTPNPHISFDSLPLAVVTERLAWPEADRPRRAAVSSFGFGGTNAHVVLEQAPATAPGGVREPAERPLLFPLSASSAAAVRRAGARLASWIEEHREASLDDVSGTLAHHRSHARSRAAVVASDRTELVDRLRCLARGEVASGLVTGTRSTAPGAVWVFSGQGSQWPGMGRDLLDGEPAFARAVEELEPLLSEAAGLSLVGALTAGEELTGVEVVQPVLFGLQVALGATWRSYGVEPAAVIGHSMGEVSAAVVAGVLSLEGGVEVVCRRSRLLAKVAGQGAMALVATGEREIAARLSEWGLDGSVSVAVVAGPESVVISGETEGVERAVAGFLESAVDARLVQVDVASHSPQVDGLLEDLRAELAGVRPGMGAVPLYSTVHDPARQMPMDAAYWADNLRRPVRLMDAVLAAAADGHSVFVEVSPHPVLVRSVESTLRHAGIDDAAVVPTLLRDTDERLSLLTALGAIHCAGLAVRWDDLADRGTLLELPTTPWDRQRHWAVPARRRRAVGEHDGHPLLGRGLELATAPDTRAWLGSVSTRTQPWLAQHAAAGAPLLPAACAVEMILAAAREAGVDSPVVRDLAVERPLWVEPESTWLQTVLAGRPADAAATVEIHARRDGGEGWRRWASARVHAGEPHADEATGAQEPIGEDLEAVDVSGFYQDLARHGLSFGAAFRGIRTLRAGRHRAVAEVALPAEAGGGGGYGTHPALVDACLQVVAAALTDDGHGTTALLTGVDELSLRPTAGPVVVEARVQDWHGQLLASLEIAAGGRPVGRVRGIRISSASGAHGPGEQGGWTYELAWPAADVPPTPAATTSDDGGWVVIGNAGGVAGALSDRLAGAGAPAVRLDREVLAAATPSDLLSRAPALATAVRVVHCVALDLAGSELDDPGVAASLTQGAVRLLQALRQAGTGRLHVVTRDAQACGGPVPATAAPAAATLWGLGRSAALELPQVWGGLVDFDACPSGDVADLLLREVAAGDGEDQVAYRQGTRRVPRLRRISVPQGVVELDGEGARVVVGATGRIGPRVLRRLVTLGARHLVLVSRRGAGPAVREALAEFGDRVTVTDVEADVADEQAMSALFARFGNDLPPLRGAYQAAFAEGTSQVADLRDGDIAEAFRAKVAGTAVLDTLTRDHDLAEFVCFSSTTSLLGSQDLAHYAAAGAYVDLLAHARRARGLPAHVVNWGPWSDGLDESPLRAVIEAAGWRLMAGARAADLLGHVLRAERVQTVVADADWAVVAEAYGTRAPVRIVADVRAGAAPPRPGPQAAPGAGRPGGDGARDDLRHLVRGVVADVLRLDGPEALGPRQNFFEIGMDSLMVIALLRQLREHLDLDFPAEVVMQHPTVEALAQALAERSGQVRPAG